MTVVIHSFDMFELLILLFDWGLSFLNFPWEFSIFVILLSAIYIVFSKNEDI